MDGFLSPSLGVFILQLASFLLLLLIVKRFFLPIILDVLAKREAFINESIANAKLIEEKKQSLSRIEQETLQEIKDKRENSLMSIEKSHNEMMLKTKEEISSLRDEQLSQMKKEVATMRNEFLQQNKEQICNVSLSLIEGIIKKEMSDEETKRKFLDDLVNCINTIEIRAKC